MQPATYPGAYHVTRGIRPWMNFTELQSKNNSTRTPITQTSTTPNSPQKLLTLSIAESLSIAFLKFHPCMVHDDL